MIEILIAGGLVVVATVVGWLLDSVQPPPRVRRSLWILIPILLAGAVALAATQVVMSQGQALEGFAPPADVRRSCDEIRASDEARDAEDDVYVTAFVRSDGCWTTHLSPVEPGTNVEYMIAYANASENVQENVVARVNLPPGTVLVPRSTYLKNTRHPDGVLVPTDGVTTGGITIGTYDPDAGAYVKFAVAVQFVEDLQCGETESRLVGVIRPEGENEFYNTATTNLQRRC